MSDMTEIEYTDNEDILAYAAEIVAAYASNNQIQAAELPGLIQSVHATLADLSGQGGEVAEPAAPEAPPAPAVPIDASIGKDAITCLDCGKSFKTLKRHLSTEHGQTPAEYRARWGLSKDYPLVAPSYSERRAATAKKIGLGRKKAD